MIRKVALIHFVIGLLALVSCANAGSTVSPVAQGTIKSAAPNFSKTDVNSPPPVTTSQIQHTDVPSAPLPAAFWPGLTLLLVLGGVKFAHQFRRGLVRV